MVMTTRRISVDEYQKMGEVDMSGENERTELIDGEIVEMASIGSYHASSVTDLSGFMSVKVIPAGMRVSVQNPVTIDRFNELQPDIAVLRPRGAEKPSYRELNPTPDDVLLIVEVSDSTVRHDRYIKLPKYASAGIPEVWQVNLQGGYIDAFSGPNTATGEYAVMRRYTREQQLAPKLLPDVVIQVSEIL